MACSLSWCLELLGVVVLAVGANMIAKAIAISPFVRDELVALVRKDASAVGLAYSEMARRFLPGYTAHVSDVEAAFPMLPFAPWVWPFLFHRFYRSEGAGQGLFVHNL